MIVALMSYSHEEKLVYNRIESARATMTTVKDIQICINVHFDAVSLWIGSFGGAISM